jgi:3'-phosphoadenosine 5'-phosphosulfate sulfotransferase
MPRWSSGLGCLTFTQEDTSSNLVRGTVRNMRMDNVVDSVTILRKAIDELRLQVKLIRKQQTFLHDNTLYREWVKVVLPSMIALLERAYGAAKLGISDNLIEEELVLAGKIIGKDALLDSRKLDSRNSRVR